MSTYSPFTNIETVPFNISKSDGVTTLHTVARKSLVVIEVSSFSEGGGGDDDARYIYSERGGISEVTALMGVYDVSSGADYVTPHTQVLSAGSVIKTLGDHFDMVGTIYLMEIV